MRNNSLLTRRSWTAMVAALPLAAQVASTPQATPASPATSMQPSSPADDVRKNSEKLAQIEIPMSLEPAVTFHA